MCTDYIDIEIIHRKYLENPGEDTLSDLFLACRGLIFHYSKIYGGGYCIDDICQVGYEGLMKSVKNFDPDRAVKFVTYASHAIIGEIRHYVRKERRYYFPGYLMDYQKIVDTIVIANIDDEKDPVTENELANKLNVTPESVLPIMKAGIVHLSHIDISSIKTKQMESFTLPVEDKLLISQLMYNLTGLQRDVIEMLFYKQMTQNEVAEQLGLNQKQVSRIKLKSLRKMKEAKKDHKE